MKEIQFAYFKSSVEHIIKSKVIISIIFITEYLLFSINMFISNYYLLNYTQPYHVYKHKIHLLQFSLTHIVHSRFNNSHFSLIITFIVMIIYLIVIVVAHLKRLPTKAMIVCVNVLEFALCRLLFIFIVDVISNQVVFYGKAINNGSLAVTAFIFFLIALIIIITLIFKHISTHCSFCCFVVNYCFDLASKRFEQCLLLLKVLVSVNLNLLEINMHTNGSEAHLCFLNVLIILVLLLLTVYFVHSAYFNSVVHINCVLYTRIRLVFLLTLTSESFLFLTFHNHTEVMYMLLSACLFVACVLIAMNYDAMMICLNNINFDNVYEHVLITLHLIDNNAQQMQRVIYIKNVRYHFIFCKQCYLCQHIKDLMGYKTVSVKSKDDICMIIDKYHDVFMKEIERRVRKRKFYRFYYDLLCLINLMRRQKGFNFKVQYLFHKLVQKYYKESELSKYLNIKFIFLNFVNLNSLKESSKFKLMEDTISLTQKVSDVIHAIQQIIKGKIKSSRDLIELSNQIQTLKSKDIRKFLSNRDNMQSYPVVILRLIIEDMLSIPIKKEEGLLWKEKNYSEEFLDYHFTNDKNMFIEVTLQRNSFLIRKTGTELINYVDHEIAKLFPTKIKKSGIDTLKDLINSSERKKLFSFVVNLNLPENNNRNGINKKKSSKYVNQFKESFMSSDSECSCSESQQGSSCKGNNNINNDATKEDEIEYYLFDFYFTVSPGINNSDLSLIGEYAIHKNDLLISQIAEGNTHGNGNSNMLTTGIGNDLLTSYVGIKNTNAFINAPGSTVIMGDLLWLKDTTCNAIICSNRHCGAISRQGTNGDNANGGDNNNNDSNRNVVRMNHNHNPSSKAKVSPYRGIGISNSANENEVIYYVSKSLFTSTKLTGIRNLREFKKNFGNEQSSNIINSPFKHDGTHFMSFVYPKLQYMPMNAGNKSSVTPSPWPFRRAKAPMNCSTIIVPNNKHIFNELETQQHKQTLQIPTPEVVAKANQVKSLKQQLNTLQMYFTKRDKDGNYIIKRDKDDYALVPQLSIKSGKKIYKVYLFIKLSNNNTLYSKRKSQLFELGSTLQLFKKDTVKVEDTKTATRTGTATNQGDGLGTFMEGSNSVNTLSSNTSIFSIKLYKKEDKKFKAETEREQRLIVYKNRFHTFTVVIVSFSFFIIIINVVSLIVNFYLNSQLISINDIYSNSKETNRLFFSLLSSFFSTMCVGYPNSTQCVNYLLEKCKEDQTTYNLSTNVFHYIQLENEKKLNEMILHTKQLKQHIYALNSAPLTRMFNVDFNYLMFGVVNDQPSLTTTTISFSHALEILSTSLNTVLKYPQYSTEPIYVITSLAFDMSNVYGMHYIKKWQLEYYNVLLNYKTYLLTFESIQAELYLKLKTQLQIYSVVPLLFLVLNYFLHLVLFGLLSVYLKSFLTLVKMDMNGIIKKTKEKESYQFYIKKYNILLALSKYYEQNPNYLIHKLDVLFKKQNAVAQANQKINTYYQSTNNNTNDSGKNTTNIYVDSSVLLVNGQQIQNYSKENDINTTNTTTTSYKHANMNSHHKKRFIHHSAAYITELNIPVTFQLLLIIFVFFTYFTTFFVVFIVVWMNSTNETTAKFEMVESITSAEYSTYNDFTLIQIMFLGNITEEEISNLLTNNTDPFFLSNDIHNAMKITYNYERLNNINNKMMPLIDDEFDLTCDNFYNELQDTKMFEINKEHPQEKFIENISTLCNSLQWFVVADEIMIYKHLFYSMYKLLKTFTDRSYEGIMKMLNDNNIFKIYYYQYFVVRFMVTWYNSVVYKDKIDESTQKETMILFIYLIIEVVSELGLFLVLSKLFFKAIKQTNNNLTLLTRAFFTH